MRGKLIKEEEKMGEGISRKRKKALRERKVWGGREEDRVERSVRKDREEKWERIVDSRYNW